jgi:hypothetical protein
MSDPTLNKASDTAMTTDASSTVKFNVGGRLYEVPRSLVEKFPSTMLARMASDTWQKDPEATLFIGRSGERFEYSLDYMRADKVWLPLNIPKEAFLDDLDFYGFEDVDPRKIHGGSSNLAAAQHLLKCKEEHEEFLSTCKTNVKAAEMNVKAAAMNDKAAAMNVEAAETTIKCAELAYECFVRFSLGKSVLFKSTYKKAEFQDHLAKYGLAFGKGEMDENFRYSTLALKAKEDTIN